MLRDDYYWDTPDYYGNPPYEPCICDRCKEPIPSDEDVAEIRGLFPRILCDRCVREETDEDDVISWFVAS